MLKSKLVDKRIISNLDSLESYFKSARKELEQISEISLPSEENVKNMFSELRTKAMSIKTEKSFSNNILLLSRGANLILRQLMICRK
ncbi:MAG: hypothetical protein NZ903_03375 [Candidatus Micrarchaeota archaeon]|nr:hypothetical protein [Candidatus Micrarchaeota archaeon]